MRDSDDSRLDYLPERKSSVYFFFRANEVGSKTVVGFRTMTVSVTFCCDGDFLMGSVT